MLELTNVISISVTEAPVGLGAYNINNLALFTSDQFLVNTGGDVYRVYVSAAAVGDDFGTGTETYSQAVAVFSQNPNILAGGGNLIIFPLTGGGTEALGTAIARTKDLIFYCGIISTAYGTNSGWKTLADTIQGYGDKILFIPSTTYSDVAGAFTDIMEASDSNTRCLYYSTSALTARLFAAAYASRAMSVNFAGSNTAITMNLKQLATIDPDDGVTQTYYNALATAGVDAYISYAGVSSVVSNGANRYFDEVYNLVWFVSALKVAGFNALAQVSNKIPQTEPGMSLLKSAYRSVCEQAKGNGYIGPGSWTSAEWFGVQGDMNNNILERGYYIYSAPVNLQATADRTAREAPLVQIAIKEAGAIHSSSVIVNINQ
jgi:hypothetical protein